MRVVPLGVGGAFSKTHYHNNYVFDFGNTKLLVDAGTTLRYSLAEAGFKETDITDIFITHFHADHVGGLEEFLQRCYYIHGHKPTLWMTEKQVPLFDRVLLEGLYEGDAEKLAEGDIFYKKMVVGQESRIIEIPMVPDESFVKIRLIDTTDFHKAGMISYALDFVDTRNGQNFIFTSDIRDLDGANMKSFVKEETVAIFQDLQLHHQDDGVHAELEQILNHYDPETHWKIWVMHYGDNFADHVDSIMSTGMSMVRQGQSYVFFQ